LIFKGEVLPGGPDSTRDNMPRWLADARMVIFEAAQFIVSWVPSLSSALLSAIAGTAFDAHDRVDRSGDHNSILRSAYMHVSSWTLCALLTDRVWNIPARIPAHHEIELAVPVGRTAEALRIISDMIQTEQLFVNHIIEVR